MKIEEYPIGRGRYLIEASAGTGKTWTITHLFCRLVLEGMPVSRILVTTFTNTGAAELKERIVELLNAFHDQPKTLVMPQIAPGSFEKKLYSMFKKAGLVE